MAYLIFVSFIWAFSFPLIKGCLTDIDPAFVSFIRMLLSLLVLLPFLRIRGLGRIVPLRLAAIGAVQFGLMYVAYIASYQYLPAHTIALLTTTTPIFVTMVNDLHERRFNRLFFFSALLAVIGGAVIKYPDQSLRANLLGIVLVQASNVAFAAGQVYYKKLASGRESWNDAHVFALPYAGAVVLTGAVSLATTSFNEIHLTAPQSMVLFYLGVIASGLCFFLWNRGARHVNEGTLAIMNNLKIPLGIVASLLLLHESTDIVRLVAGFFLMCAGAWLCERRR